MSGGRKISRRISPLPSTWMSVFRVVLAFPSDASQKPASFVGRAIEVSTAMPSRSNRTCSPPRVTGVRSLIRAKPSLTWMLKMLDGSASSGTEYSTCGFDRLEARPESAPHGSSTPLEKILGRSADGFQPPGTPSKIEMVPSASSPSLAVTKRPRDGMVRRPSGA